MSRASGRRRRPGCCSSSRPGWTSPTLDSGTARVAPAGSARSEARAALAELGYGPDEIAGALDGVDADAPVEEMVRSALRELVRNR